MSGFVRGKQVHLRCEETGSAGSTSQPQPALVKATGLTPATVNKSLAHLERICIVGEVTNRRRGRVFSHIEYVAALSAELQPPQ